MLEKNWLKWIYDNNYNLPSNAQVLFSDEKAQPDFYYDKGNIAVFIDGPVHNYPDVSIRDKKAEDRLNCSGIESIRFTADNSTWKTTIEKYADVFGKGI